MIAMLNGHMLGTPTEPGEHVDWNAPDVLTEAELVDLLGMPVDEYAQANPHMIVWTTEQENSHA